METMNCFSGHTGTLSDRGISETGLKLVSAVRIIIIICYLAATSSGL